VGRSGRAAGEIVGGEAIRALSRPDLPALYIARAVPSLKPANLLRRNPDGAAICTVAGRCTEAFAPQRCRYPLVDDGQLASASLTHEPAKHASL